ncbi:glycoside hydrolase family 30 protein [Granulicella arctica]|uniref:glycoside hydrolase family 30 protein n=1 Tax=Granulicella arctica TaxID=940613 RepID=UPI0021DF60D8|nr:glycoside hydrolase family 30 beta sandwich domain-containing protein [Granulicella arctica]
MRPIIPRGFLLCLICLLPVAAHAERRQSVTEWLTTADRSSLVAKQPDSLVLLKHGRDKPADIMIDDNDRSQTIDGFGFALTGGSAQLLMKMSPTQRHALLVELFGHDPKSIDVSYLRVSIGASDMNDHVFTYDDMPPGQRDPELKQFSVKQDEADVIPVLQEILTISPKIKILASPWTAPSWMKTVEAAKGGALRPEFYPVYAQYFVLYLEAMQRHGIRIDAITTQNEPLNPKNTPSMVMQPEEQATFIKTLGPALAKNNLQTKIILYDHNCDRPDYPLAILNDPVASKFVDGSGFHLYGGKIDAMTQVHDAFKQKNLYFTEQMVIEEKHEGIAQPISHPVDRVVIGAMRNWSRNVLLWNLAADPTFGPHTTSGGCPVCQGAITLDADAVQRNIAYYAIAQVSKFVPPGSVRIASTEPIDGDLPNVAFHTPDGHTVLLVVNRMSEGKDVNVQWHGQAFHTNLGAGSVATFVW